MYEDDFSKRITQLRIAKGVSARDMSLSLGHSPSYIHSIVSGKALPSMAEFLYICEYFKLTPMEFFDEGSTNVQLISKLLADLKELDESQIASIHAIIKEIKR